MVMDRGLVELFKADLHDQYRRTQRWAENTIATMGIQYRIDSDSKAGGVMRVVAEKLELAAKQFDEASKALAEALKK